MVIARGYIFLINITNVSCLPKQKQLLISVIVHTVSMEYCGVHFMDSEVHKNTF